MNEINDIVKALENQDPFARDACENLLRKLPNDMEATAQRYGALLRRRGIRSAKDLFMGLALYVAMALSQRALAAICSGIANISDQAWQKKLSSVSLGCRICCSGSCRRCRIKISGITKAEQSSCWTPPFFSKPVKKGQEAVNRCACTCATT